MLLEGIFLPLTTPFHPDGRLFLRKLEMNVERYSKTGAAGMIVLSREGEGASLTDVEAREVLKTVIGAAADEKVMLARVGRDSVSAALEMAGVAAELGYDAVAVTAPSYANDPRMGDEVRVFFECVADASPLPVVLMDSLPTPFPPALMDQLAAHSNVIGGIDDWSSRAAVEGFLGRVAAHTREVEVTSIFAAVTRRMKRKDEIAGGFVPAASLGGGAATLTAAQPKLKTRKKRVGFQFLGGQTGAMLSCWEAGAAGSMPALGPAAPQACCEVWQAFKDGDPALAAEKQDRIRAVGKMMEGTKGVAALKYGCDLNAYFGGRPRLPLLPLDAEAKDAVERALAGIQN